MQHRIKLYLTSLLLICSFWCEATAAVHLIDQSYLDSELRSNQGQVVLVHFWASHCSTCVSEMPHLLSVHQRHADHLRTMLIAIQSEPEQSEIEQKLSDLNVTMDSYHWFEAELPKIQSIRERWNGRIPVTFVYDKKGYLRYFWNAPLTANHLEHFESRVKLLLTE